MLTIDTHCDTMKELLDDNAELTNDKYDVNLKGLQKNMPHIQTFAAYISPKYVEENMAFKRASEIISKYYEQIEKYNITHVENKKTLEEVINNNKLGSILSIENGSAIEGNISNLEKFYKQGVRMFSLTWNPDNDLACGALTENDTGITKLRNRSSNKNESNGSDSRCIALIRKKFLGSDRDY